MSLQIWLPLNGNLKNYGVSGLTFKNVSSSNTTSSTAGNIGSCYANNSASAGGIVSNERITLGTNQSVFCWIKFTSLSSGSSLGLGAAGQHSHEENAGMGITIKYISSTTGYLSLSTGTGSSRTYNTYCGSTLLSANTWYHVGYTYDGAKIKLYVNGKLDGTHNFSGMYCPENYFQVFCWSVKSINQNIYGGYRTIGSIYDVRAYDHCLNYKEVRDISRSLMLYYPFREEATGTLVDCSGYKNHATFLSGSLVIDNETPRNRASGVLDGATYVRTGNLKIPTNHTISLWLKRTKEGHFLDWRDLSGNTGLQPIYFNSNGQIQYWSSAATSAASDYFSYVFSVGVWYHVCLVKNGSTVKLYVNGAESGSKATATGDWSLPLTIGARCSGTNIMSGQISDLRIYGSALDAAAIKDLYDTPIWIGKDKTLGAVDYYESDTSKVRFKNSGTVEMQGINEVENTRGMAYKTLEDGSAWARIYNIDFAAKKEAFASTAEVAKCEDKTNRFSLMGLVENFAGKKVTMTNMVPRPVSGNTGFNANAVANTTYLKYPGGVSLKLTGTTSANEITAQSTVNAHYIPGHTYYARAEILQETVQGGADFYWKIAEPRIIPGTAATTAKQWKIVSGVRTATQVISTAGADWAEGDYPYRIDYNNSKTAGAMWFDGIMLIDLTATFGAGCEPTKAWCDANIPFFTGTKTVSFSDQNDISIYEFMLTYPSMGNGKYNRWRQKISPNSAYVTSTANTGYVPVHTDFTSYAAPITKSSSSGSSVYSCNLAGNWWAPVGQLAIHSSTGIPAADASTQTSCELWVRVDTLDMQENITKIFDKYVLANQIIEI